MSSRHDTRTPNTQRTWSARFARSLFGWCVLPLALGCGNASGGPGHKEDSGGPAGGSGSVPASAGAAGSAAGAPSQGGSGGTVPQAGSANGGSANGGAPSAASSAAGSAGASGGATNNACGFQCVDQCVEAGGTKRDGTCAGTQICCDGATAPMANPFAELVPSAKEVGLLLANRFAKQANKFTSVKDLPGDGYKVACEWYGGLRIAKFTNTTSLLDSLVTKFDPFKADFASAMLGGEAHVDRYIFGIVPLEIYLQTKKAEYLDMGIKVADGQNNSQVRHAIDDMFMMTILQVEAYRAAKASPDPSKAAKYLDFMAPIMIDYLKAQKDNGLFYHNDTQGPVYWGRGNGWFAAGMAEILKDLTPGTQQHTTILAGYKKMMAGLLKVQGQSGLWYQVLDRPTDSKNWVETSSTAMFTYAMIAGVRAGLLDAATYVPPVKTAWAGLRQKISATGDVSDICIGTYFLKTPEEYMALTKLTGDGHGQAPVQWAAAEILR